MAASSLTSSQVIDELRLALARTREGCMCQVSPMVVREAARLLQENEHENVLPD